MPLLIGAIVIGVLFRCWLLLLPIYKYVYYDEAIPGLMALDILDGKFPLVYWAHPYLGSLDALSAAGLFYLFGPSTQMLRVSVLLYFAVFAMFIFKLGQQVTGKAIPWYLVIFLVLPPLGLNQFSLSTIGGYMHVVAIGTIMMYLTARLLVETTAKQEIILFALLGFSAGLGFWTFIMVVPYMAGCYGTLFLKYRFKLFRLPLLASVLMFWLGSLPTWIWNIQHDFIGFTSRSETVELGEIPKHLDNLYQLFCNLLGRVDEYAHLPSFHTPLTWVITALLIAIMLYWFCYAAVDLLKAAVSKQRTPTVLDLVVICFLVSAASFVLSVKGERSLIRYGMIFYSTLPLLIAWFFHSLSRQRKWLYTLFIPALLLMVLPYNVALILEASRATDSNDMEHLIDFMKKQKLYHAYAHYTVGHSITFESQKEIIISDFGGFRNIDYLREVDRSGRVAIVTDRTIAIPHPDALEHQLNFVTCDFKLRHIGKYTVFYDFVMQNRMDRDVSSKIKAVYTEKKQVYADRMTDRNLSTFWTTDSAQQSGDEVVVEMDEPVDISQISFQPGVSISDFPKRLAIDVSPDGKHWKTVKESGVMIEAFLPMGDKPRLFGNGQFDICLAAVQVRFLRLRLEKDDSFAWSIAEFFVFTPAEKDRETQMGSVFFETILKEHPESYIYASPWSAAQFDALNQSGNKIFPLYPDELLYHNVYRRWDVTRRYIDFTKENLFVLFPQWEDSTVHHLQKLGIKFHLEKKGSLTLVRTVKQDRLLQPLHVLDNVKIECRKEQAPFPLYGGTRLLPQGMINDAGRNGSKAPCNSFQEREREEYGPASEGEWQVYRMQNPENRVDGFIFPQAGKNVQALEVKVFLSEDGVAWRQQEFSAYGSSYWSDYSLLEVNTGQQRGYYFPNPVSSPYITVAVRPPDIGTATLPTCDTVTPLLFNLMPRAR